MKKQTPHQKVDIKIQIQGAPDPILNDTFDSDGKYEWYGEQLPLHQYVSNVVASALGIADE
ncbi:hypothetical protein SAMN04488136_11618 [Vibrio xiamenensis]|uniref:Uncharacterized protein n=1 Tax=Vibrio xiamenensis TaxID=861298 RepID=A0A1G8CE89_9VIBR|nr:hypothetical protein [Vibrio xiamenensis]SDH43688.1 hypothetical protein SAMN04488136_11618 [Vibrio xiamenensis]